MYCDVERAEELRKTISKDKAEILIGISWNSSAKQPGAHHRNITLSDLAKHLHAPGVRLVNLQYGDVTDDIIKLKDDHGIEVTQVPDVDNRNDIDGLAALIMACDEVISIDNATVHLSGALGAKTKILLPFNRNWQWGTSGSSSYWYNSVELYRQQSAGDWKKVLEQLKVHMSKQTHDSVLIEECDYAIGQGKAQGLSEDKISELDTRIKSAETSSVPYQSELISLGKYFNDRQLSKAETLAVSLTQRFPRHPFGWKVLGAVLNQTGRVSESLAPSKKAVELAPDDVNARNNLGVIYGALNRLKRNQKRL